MRRDNRLRYVLRSGALFVAYVTTARMGLAMTAVGGVATTVWPPSGIAVGALLLGGYRLWPAIGLGAFVANVSIGVPVAAATGIALGNTIEALLGAFLVRRFGGSRDEPFDTVRRTLALIVFAAMVSTAIAAMVGTSSAALATMNRHDPFATVWWNWWVGDALGILLVVPVMLGTAMLWRERSRPERPVEGALTLLLVCGVSILVFGRRLPWIYIPQTYAVFPPLFWVALRFRQPATAFATFVVAVVAVIGTAGGAGPFAAATRAESLLLLQAFMTVVAVTGLIIGAVSAERERAQRRVADEHAFVSAVLDTAGLLVVLDRAGRIVRSNRACGVLLGTPPREADNRYFWDVFAVPEDKATIEAAFCKLVQNNVRGEWETRCAVAEGRVRTVLWSSTPLLDAAGSLKYVISSGNDLTDRRQLQSQLVVSDRLAAVGTLAAGIGHEINNPLAYLMLCLETAAKVVATRYDIDELQKLLAIAREGADRIRKIVSDLRTLARADSAQSVPVDVHQVLDSSIRMAWNHIRHRAELVKCYGRVRYAQADTGRLGQVFLNLLMNAVQAIPEGYANRNMIRISTEMDGDGRIAVSISDTGAGIEAPVIHRLFEPFFTTKPVGEGIGLGLSVCHAIVTGFGGSITAESEPGRGTLFRVSLPASLTASSPPEENRTESSDASTLQILIVDDEISIARALAGALEQHHVTCANSGHEALELVQKQDFDIVLCDLLMPELTGMDFYERVSELKPGYEERIVFMTGGAFTPRAQQFLARVPNRKIDKPFDFAVIRALIAERSEHKASLH